MWNVEPGHAIAVAGAALALAGWLAYRRLVPTPVPVTIRLGAALAAASGGAHLALANGDHGAVTNVLFLLDGLALLALAPIALTRLPWRIPAAALLASTVLAYLVYLVAGIEGPDQVGMAAKLAEILALGLLMVPVGPLPALEGWTRWAVVAAGVPLLVLLSGTVVGIDDVARPGAHHHAGAVVQATNAIPTAEQYQAADELRMETAAAIQPYRDPAAAERAGYRPGSGTGAVHWMNNGYVKSGAPLDPQHPAGLVYVNSHEGPVLVGAMFEAGKIGKFGPDPGGPLTAWHEHTHICVTPVGGFEFSLETPYAVCPLGSVSVSVPPMLHVWIVPNRGGPFAVDLDPAVIRAIEKG